MNLQNRVTPFGELIATPAKGLFMGNRGILHDEHGSLTNRRWTHKSWVTCALSFKGYHRTPRKRIQNEYTELFFLDEATALAAGHRPCGHCRYKDFVRFVEYWTKGNGFLPDMSAKDIDARLHAERVNRFREKITYPARIDDLPNGVFIEFNAEPTIAWLLWNAELLKWQPEGYWERRAKPGGKEVVVLTPKSTVNAIVAGYSPHVHH